jgi:hypothetical protein
MSFLFVNLLEHISINISTLSHLPGKLDDLIGVIFHYLYIALDFFDTTQFKFCPLICMTENALIPRAVSG